MAAGGSVEVVMTAFGATQVVKDLKSVTGAMGDVEKGSGQTGRALNGFGASLGSVSQLAAQFGVALGVKELVEFGVEAVQAGASADRLGASLDALTGGQADVYIRAVGEASLGTISNMDAMTASARALQLGVVDSAEEMSQLTQASLALGRAMGIDATQAMNDLVTGLGRMSPMILDNLGLSMKQAEIQAEVNRVMSQYPGITEQAATKQAMFNLAIQQANVLLEAQGGLTNDAAAEIERFQANIENVTTAAGQWVVSGIMPIIEGARAAAEAWRAQALEVASTSTTYDEWLSGVHEVFDGLNLLEQQLLLSTGAVNFSRQAFEEMRQTMIENVAATNNWAGASEALAQRWQADMATYAEAQVTIDDLTGAFNEAAAAVQAYIQTLEQQAALQLDLIQQVPEFAEAQGGLADVFALGVGTLDNYNLSASDTLRLYQELGLATGELTAAQIEQSQAVQQLSNLWVSGNISAQQYADALAAIQAGADAATVTQDLLTQAAEEASAAFLEEAQQILENEGSMEEYSQAMQNANAAAQQALEEMTNAATANLEEQLDTAQSSIDELFTKLENAPDEVVTEFNLQAEGALDELNKMIDLMKDAQKPVEATISVDVSAATGDVQALGDAIDTVGMKSVRAEIDTTAVIAQGGVNGLEADIDDVGAMSVEAEVTTTAGDAIGPVSDLAGAAAGAAGTYELIFNITQNGNVPTVPSGGGSGSASGYAEGGSYAAGELMVVGEEGPELMIPDSAGTIIPNDMLGEWGGGGDTYIEAGAVVVHAASGQSEAQIAEMVIAKMSERLRRDRKSGAGYAGVN